MSRIISPGSPRRLALSAALGACLVAGGCATTPRATAPAPIAETVHPIEISISRLSHSIRYAPGALDPDADEILAVDRYLADADPGAARIVLDRAPSSIGEARAARLGAALAYRGFTIAGGVPTAAEGEVRLTVERYRASVRGCPDWSMAPGNNPANRPHSDFGCSTQANLAAMIADPRDLVSGRTPGPVFGDPALAGVQRYRAGKTLPPPSESINLPSASLSLTPSPTPGPGPGQ